MYGKHVCTVFETDLDEKLSHPSKSGALAVYGVLVLYNIFYNKLQGAFPAETPLVIYIVLLVFLLFCT